MQSKIRDTVASCQNELITFLRKMIAIPSLSGQEEEIVHFIQKEMIRLGYDEVRIDGFGNCIGRLGSGSRTIALDGHCDTVGVGNPDGWTVDPFHGMLKNGIIFGRGAADQKGGLASAIYAGHVLKQTTLPKNVSLYVVASVLEENFEGISWQHLIEKEKIVPHAIVLTEPTNLEIKIGQRGRMDIEIHVHGISCHGSAPERGENAIYKAAPIIQDVEKLNNQLTSESRLGKGSITITDIRSVSPSLCAVADHVTLHLDRRLTEGEELTSAVKEIQSLPSIIKVSANVSVPKPQITSFTGWSQIVEAYYPMWLMDEESPLIKTARRVFKDQFEKKPQVGVWTFSTNGVLTKGIHQIPTFGFGPGEEIYAHSPQDQIRVQDLLKATEFYAAFINNWSKMQEET